MNTEINKKQIDVEVDRLMNLLFFKPTEHDKQLVTNVFLQGVNFALKSFVDRLRSENKKSDIVDTIENSVKSLCEITEGHTKSLKDP